MVSHEQEREKVVKDIKILKDMVREEGYNRSALNAIYVLQIRLKTIDYMQLNVRGGQDND